jgi:predicted house-cleaning noncanonical NTP pyrophosphatase (MazG superfamily)
MRKFIFNKLVRDDIPEHMKTQGESVDVRQLTPEEYLRELIKKIGEEAVELASANNLKIEEVADLQELLDCTAVALGITKEQVVEVQARKRAEYGSFIGRQYIYTVEVPDGNPWISHLEANPQRYPEVS